MRVLLAFAWLALSAVSAWAQTYPNRPIAFVFPYAAGSAADVMWRVITQEASKRLGQPIIVEYRTGAGGRVGFDAVMRAPKDGYTIGFVAQGMAVNQPLTESKLYVEPGKDYSPILIGTDTAFVLAIHSGQPFRDLNGMLAYARANPGKLNSGSSGIGTGTHLAVEMINTMAGVKIVHVPYKGTVPAIQAAMGGEIEMMFGSAEMKPQIASGRLTAIATTGAKRWRQFPQVPTLAEAGLKDAVIGAWTGIAGPAGVPRDIVLRLNQAYNDALKQPEIRDKIEEFGFDVVGGSPEEFAAQTRADMERFRPVIKAAGLLMN